MITIPRLPPPDHSGLPQCTIPEKSMDFGSEVAAGLHSYNRFRSKLDSHHPSLILLFAIAYLRQCNYNCYRGVSILMLGAC